MPDWPWAGDDHTARLQRVAQSYRKALRDADPTACAVLDRKFTDLGQTWITGALELHDRDDSVTVDVAADLAGVTPQAVYQWIHAGTLAGIECNDGRLRVIVGHVRDLQAAKRQRRTRRRRN